LLGQKWFARLKAVVDKEFSGDGSGCQGGVRGWGMAEMVSLNRRLGGLG
jgi:hypothetical protein